MSAVLGGDSEHGLDSVRDHLQCGDGSHPGQEDTSSCQMKLVKSEQAWESVEELLH